MSRRPPWRLATTRSPSAASASTRPVRRLPSAIWSGRLQRGGRTGLFSAQAVRGVRPDQGRGWAGPVREHLGCEPRSGAGGAPRTSCVQYQQRFDELTKQSHRLVSIAGYGVDGQDFYAAIWQKAAGPVWVARHAMTRRASAGLQRPGPAGVPFGAGVGLRGRRAGAVRGYLGERAGTRVGRASCDEPGPVPADLHDAFEPGVPTPASLRVRSRHDRRREPGVVRGHLGEANRSDLGGAPWTDDRGFSTPSTTSGEKGFG